MVRIKEIPKSEGVKRSLHKPNSSQKQVLMLDEQVAMAGPKSSTLQATEYSKSQSRSKLEVKNKQAISRFVTAYMDATNESEDSVFRDNISEEFVKERYRKANDYSITAAILFLVTPLFAITIGALGAVSFLMAIIMSILAIRIYREYKNPGVQDRYFLAFTTLILSIVAILVFFGFVIHVISLFAY